MKIRLLIIYFVITNTIFSIDLHYRFDESYRIESTVYQNVLFNNRIELSSIILNKYSVNIISSDKESAKLLLNQHVFQESKGLKSVYYTTHTKESGEIIQFLDGEINSLSSNSFPAVKGVPVFPKRDLKVGDSWTSNGIEYFNLKNGFNIDDTIFAEFRVFYNLRELTKIDNKNMAIIDINYNIFKKITPYLEWGDFYPIKISSSSKQILYWDLDLGRPYSVDDTYVLDFYTSTGDKYTFKGTTKSKSWPKNNLDKSEFTNLFTELKTTPQTTVTEEDDFIRITFNSLLFDPESWNLRESVKKYLNRIGETLKEQGDINIRVLGHTALFGKIDQEYLNTLSTNRAKSVADYLVENNYIDSESIEIQGLAGDIPVDTNSTPEGRSNNRRVEIDILRN